MKFIYLVLSLFLVLNIHGQKGIDYEVEQNGKTGTKFEFDKTYVELGNVKKGEKRSFKYILKNTGTEDINIDYLSYCDCTEVEYEENKPIKPGKTMVFNVVFDSKDKNEEETISIEMELKNINPKDKLPFYLTLDYHFKIVK